MQPVTYNGGVPGNRSGQRTLRIPTDRRNSIKNDSGVFAQDRWTIKRATINAGVRWDWFISATRSGNAAGRHVQRRRSPTRECPDGKNNLNANCAGTRARTGRTSARASASSYDVFGNGKTAIKASVARYVNGVGLAAGSIADNNNPETTVGLTDTRAVARPRQATARRSTPPARSS